MNTKTSIAAGVCLFLSINVAFAKCYPVDKFKEAMLVVHPYSKVLKLNLAQQLMYVKKYNKLPGKQIKLNEVIIFEGPKGNALIVPIENNIGCQRHYVGPVLHKLIKVSVFGKPA